MAKDCRRCGLVNHDAAVRCDCGYDFDTGRVEGSFAPSDPRSIVEPVRPLLALCVAPNALAALVWLELPEAHVPGLAPFGTEHLIMLALLEAVVLAALWVWFGELRSGQASPLKPLAVVVTTLVALYFIVPSSWPRSWLGISLVLQLALYTVFVGAWAALVARRSNAARLVLLALLFPWGWACGLGARARAYCLQHGGPAG